MVTFTCADCGDSLRKNAVEKHSFRCRFTVITCIDCFQEFTYVMNTGDTSLTIRYPLSSLLPLLLPDDPLMLLTRSV